MLQKVHQRWKSQNEILMYESIAEMKTKILNQRSELFLVNEIKVHLKKCSTERPSKR